MLALNVPHFHVVRSGDDVEAIIAPLMPHRRQQHRTIAAVRGQGCVIRPLQKIAQFLDRQSFAHEWDATPRRDIPGKARRSPSDPSNAFGARPGACLQKAPDLLRKRAYVDWLGEVAVEAGGEEAIAVLLHRERCQRYYLNGSCNGIDAQAAERGNTVHVRQLDVHQNQAWPVIDRQSDALLRRRGFQRAVAIELQQVADQFKVLLIVFDDEDQVAWHWCYEPTVTGHSLCTSSTNSARLKVARSACSPTSSQASGSGPRSSPVRGARGEGRPSACQSRRRRPGRRPALLSQIDPGSAEARMRRVRRVQPR